MSIKDNLKYLIEEIESECDKIGRDSNDITLVAASKYVDYRGIQQAYDAGLKDFGENRVIDALDKIENLPDDIHWHFIGHLQRNKATKVIGNFELIHSVDSIRLADKIEQVATDKDLCQNIMLEVNVSGEETKFGAGQKKAFEIVEHILNLPHVKITGLMTMAPFTDDEEVIRDVFRNTRKLRENIKSEFDIKLPYLSMGMTNDWRIANQELATHLRIGSAIFKK